jgi:hypothetical protein
MANVPLNDLEEEDIGYYVEFSKEDKEKYFPIPENFYGNYFNYEYKWT